MELVRGAPWLRIDEGERVVAAMQSTTGRVFTGLVGAELPGTALVLTSHRMLLVHDGRPDDEIALTDVSQVLSKVAGLRRRALVVRSDTRRPIRIEGPGRALEEFAKVIAGYLRRERPALPA